MQIASTTLDSTLQPVNARKPGRLQFGSSMSLGPLTNILSTLEQQPLADLVVKDIAAFNVPKIALARTWKERIDTATLELSNTAITLVSSLCVPLLLRQLVKPLTQVPDELSKEIPFAELAKTRVSAKLARMGVSFGFYFPFAAAFWAAPFFRNWLTLKRTQSANFESLIGFEGVKSSGPKRSLPEEMAYQKNTAWKVFATGLALGAASLLSFGLSSRMLVQFARQAQRNGNKLKHPLEKFLTTKGARAWNWLFNNFDLKGKGANQIEGMPAQLIFWGLPAYLGWIHGARSNHERRERMLQSGNALFWFFAAPKLSNYMWSEKFRTLAGNADDWSQKFKDAVKANKPSGQTLKDAILSKADDLSYNDILKEFRGSEAQKKTLISLRNKKFAISGLAIPIGALALVQLINFRLTEKKLKKAMAAQTTIPSVQHAPQPHRLPSMPSFQSGGNYSPNGVYGGYSYPGNPFYSAPVRPSSGNWQYPPQPAFVQRPPQRYQT